jgi:sugar transferase EpsL
MTRLGKGRHPGTSIFKRAFDLIVSGTLLVVLMPLCATAALAVGVTMGRPVLFRQERPGLNKRSFVILKLRTMRSETAVDGEPIREAARITGLGAVLRRASIDEIPQLWNVLKGDMSLVGPRPLLPRYTPFFRSDELARFTTRPGLTGLAQISGRNAVGWDDRLAFDVEYVNQWSLWLDLRILFRSAALVLSGGGVERDVHALLRDLDIERAGEVPSSEACSP